MPAVRKRPEARMDFIKKNPRFLAVRKGTLDGPFDQQEPWEDRLVMIEYFSWLLPLALAPILCGFCRAVGWREVSKGSSDRKKFGLLGLLSRPS